MAQPIHKSFALHMSLVVLLWVVGSGCWSIPTGRTSLHNPDRPHEVEEGILHYEERLHRKWRRTWEPIYKTGYYGKKISQQIEQYRIGLSGFDMKVLNSLVRLPPKKCAKSLTTNSIGRPESSKGKLKNTKTANIKPGGLTFTPETPNNSRRKSKTASGACWIAPKIGEFHVIHPCRAKHHVADGIQHPEPNRIESSILDLVRGPASLLAQPSLQHDASAKGKNKACNGNDQLKTHGKG